MVLLSGDCSGPEADECRTLEGLAYDRWCCAVHGFSSLGLIVGDVRAMNAGVAAGGAGLFSAAISRLRLAVAVSLVAGSDVMGGVGAAVPVRVVFENSVIGLGSSDSGSSGRARACGHAHAASVTGLGLDYFCRGGANCNGGARVSGLDISGSNRRGSCQVLSNDLQVVCRFLGWCFLAVAKPPACVACISLRCMRLLLAWILMAMARTGTCADANHLGQRLRPFLL